MQVLSRTALNIDQVDELVLVGGSTRMAKVPPFSFRPTPQYIVCARLASALMSFGTCPLLCLMRVSSSIPRRLQIRSLLREHFGGKEPNCAVSPEEAVAHGTAIQAAILTDRKRISVGATEASLHAHLADDLQR